MAWKEARIRESTSEEEEQCWQGMEYEAIELKLKAIWEGVWKYNTVEAS